MGKYLARLKNRALGCRRFFRRLSPTGPKYTQTKKQNVRQPNASINALWRSSAEYGVPACRTPARIGTRENGHGCGLGRHLWRCPASSFCLSSPQMPPLMSAGPCGRRPLHPPMPKNACQSSEEKRLPFFVSRIRGTFRTLKNPQSPTASRSSRCSMRRSAPRIFR